MNKKPRGESIMIWNGQDLGSVEVAEVKDSVYSFQLYNTDLSNLPTDVAAGSSALVLDTGNVYIFHQQTKTWKQL